MLTKEDNQHIIEVYQQKQHRKEKTMMSEREKQILETLTTALPEMSEYDKGYLMGKGETIADMRRAERKEKENDGSMKM